VRCAFKPIRIPRDSFVKLTDAQLPEYIASKGIFGRAEIDEGGMRGNENDETRMTNQ